MHKEFQSFLPLGTKEAKLGKSNAIICIYGRGLATSRDAWVYNFNSIELTNNVRGTIDIYNEHVYKFNKFAAKPNIDDFVTNDATEISWARGLKQHLEQGISINFHSSEVRTSLYRPFTRMWLYFDKYLNEMQYQNQCIFPTQEVENWVICVPSSGSQRISFFITNMITDLNFFAGSTPIQCFPFYTYSEDGTNRQENITDWALEQFRTHYKDNQISKLDIFHYVYGILHSPIYREKYAANLKRELPHIPFAPDFRAFASAGAKLADLHVNYEKQAEYPLKWLENKDAKLSYHVDKMTLSKDKTQIIYNDFLTLGGIPSEAFEYRLGNRSALEWIIDQYQVKNDKRSGIVNNPNRQEDPQYILRLIGKVITVSLETVKIVKSLPGIE